MMAALQSPLGTVKAVFAVLAISLNTVVMTSSLYLCSLARWFAGSESARGRVRRFLAHLAETWIACNNVILSLYRRPQWDIQLPGGLRRDGCYMVSCNHRSWVDILVLQRCFNRRLPLLRFFIKRELLRVPFLGLAWWLLDFPVMRRDSRPAAARGPGPRGHDLERARIACEKFRDIPVAMMNFPEGTRFSIGKRDRAQAPYANLLAPRIGGTGQVLYALGDQLDSLIDVTIVYPKADGRAGSPTFWQLLSGSVPRIVARVRRLEIPDTLLGRDFRSDPVFRRDLEAWMTELWREKDALISSLLAAPPPASRAAA